MNAAPSPGRRLWPLARPHWRAAVLAMLAMVAGALLEPLIPWLLKQLVDGALVRRDPSLAWQLPVAFALTFIAKGAAEYAASVASQWVAQRVMADLRQQVFEHQIGLPLRAIEAQPHGRMISLLLYDIAQLGQMLSSAWIIVIRDTLIVAGLLAYLIWTAWELTLLVAVAAPVVGLLIRLAGRHLRDANQQLQTLNGRMTSALNAALQGIREVKTYGTQDFEAGRFRDINEPIRRAAMRVARVQAANAPMVLVVAACAVAVVIYAATQLSARDALTPGDFIAYITALSLLFEPLRRLTTVNGAVQAGLAAAGSVFGLLDQPVEQLLAPPAAGSGTGTDATTVPAAATPAIAEADLAQALRSRPLQLTGVRLRYPGQDRNALDGLDLELPPGRTLALVGRSGSGKTTVASVIARLLQPDAGMLALGGQDIAGIGIGQWRRQIAWVGQQVTLFDGSLADNIAYGQPDAPRERIREAARQAHALEFIDPLPQGLDTLCGAGGISLSGGQRQRIAIARAFLRDAPLLILDEATSALDYESERHVQAALSQLLHGRTTLVIAHRLSTVRHAHRIAVMDAGRVVELGSHEELLARGGLYASLWTQGEAL